MRSMNDSFPLLRHRLNLPSAFTPEALMEAVRTERGVSAEPVPPVCLLDFDGDLTDWLVKTGSARSWPSWACFHTTLYSIEVDGSPCGIVARTIGGSYAVLVAEQLRVAGARVLLGLNIGGQGESFASGAEPRGGNERHPGRGHILPLPAACRSRYRIEWAAGSAPRSFRELGFRLRKDFSGPRTHLIAKLVKSLRNTRALEHSPWRCRPRRYLRSPKHAVRP